MTHLLSMTIIAFLLRCESRFFHGSHVFGSRHPHPALQHIAYDIVLDDSIPMLHLDSSSLGLTMARCYGADNLLFEMCITNPKISQQIENAVSSTGFVFTSHLDRNCTHERGVPHTMRRTTSCAESKRSQEEFCFSCHTKRILITDIIRQGSISFRTNQIHVEPVQSNASASTNYSDQLASRRRLSLDSFIEGTWNVLSTVVRLVSQISEIINKLASFKPGTGSYQKEKVLVTFGRTWKHETYGAATITGKYSISAKAFMKLRIENFERKLFVMGVEVDGYVDVDFLVQSQQRYQLSQGIWKQQWPIVIGIGPIPLVINVLVDLIFLCKFQKLSVLDIGSMFAWKANYSRIDEDDRVRYEFKHDENYSFRKKGEVDVTAWVGLYPVVTLSLFYWKGMRIEFVPLLEMMTHINAFSTCKVVSNVNANFNLDLSMLNGFYDLKRTWKKPLLSDVCLDSYVSQAFGLLKQLTRSTTSTQGTADVHASRFGSPGSVWNARVLQIGTTFKTFNYMSYQVKSSNNTRISFLTEEVVLEKRTHIECEFVSSQTWDLLPSSAFAKVSTTLQRKKCNSTVLSNELDVYWSRNREMLYVPQFNAIVINFDSESALLLRELIVNINESALPFVPNQIWCGVYSCGKASANRLYNFSLEVQSTSRGTLIDGRRSAKIDVYFRSLKDQWTCILSHTTSAVIFCGGWARTNTGRLYFFGNAEFGWSFQRNGICEGISDGKPLFAVLRTVEGSPTTSLQSPQLVSVSPAASLQQREIGSITVTVKSLDMSGLASVSNLYPLIYALGANMEELSSFSPDQGKSLGGSGTLTYNFAQTFNVEGLPRKNQISSFRIEFRTNIAFRPDPLDGSYYIPSAATSQATAKGQWPESPRSPVLSYSISIGYQYQDYPNYADAYGNDCSYLSKQTVKCSTVNNSNGVSPAEACGHCPHGGCSNVQGWESSTQQPCSSFSSASAECLKENPSQVTAKQACCVCGGGIPWAAPTPVPTRRPVIVATQPPKNAQACLATPSKTEAIEVLEVNLHKFWMDLSFFACGSRTWIQFSTKQNGQSSWTRQQIIGVPSLNMKVYFKFNCPDPYDGFFLKVHRVYGSDDVNQICFDSTNITYLNINKQEEKIIGPVRGESTNWIQFARPTTSIPVTRATIILACGMTAKGSIQSRSHQDYRFVVPNGIETVALSTCGSDFDTTLEVVSGSIHISQCDDCGDCGQFIRSTNENLVLSTFGAFPRISPGNSYVAKVAGYGWSSGNFTLSLRCFSSNSNPYTTTPPIIGVQLRCATSQTGFLAWSSTKLFQFTVPPKSTSIRLSTCGSKFDTVIRILFNNSEVVSCDDCVPCKNSSRNENFTISTVGANARLEQGKQYLMELKPYALANANYTVALHCNFPSQTSTPSPRTLQCQTRLSERIVQEETKNFTFLVPANAKSVSLSTCGSQFDTVVTIFETSGSSRRWINKYDDEGSASCNSTWNENIIFNLTSDNSILRSSRMYIIEIGGYASGSGTFTLSMGCVNANGNGIPTNHPTETPTQFQTSRDQSANVQSSEEGGGAALVVMLVLLCCCCLCGILCCCSCGMYYKKRNSGSFSFEAGDDGEMNEENNLETADNESAKGMTFGQIQTLDEDQAGEGKNSVELTTVSEPATEGYKVENPFAAPSF